MIFFNHPRLFIDVPDNIVRHLFKVSKRYPALLRDHKTLSMWYHEDMSVDHLTRVCDWLDTVEPLTEIIHPLLYGRNFRLAGVVPLSLSYFQDEGLCNYLQTVVSDRLVLIVTTDSRLGPASNFGRSTTSIRS